MKASEPVEATRFDIVIALMDDLQRFGLERLFRPLDGIGGLAVGENLALAAEAIGKPLILVGALREVDEATGIALRSAARRGVRILLLVDGDDPRCAQELSKLAGIPTVGFLSTGRLSAAALSVMLERMAGGEMPMPLELARTLLARTYPRPGDSIQVLRPRMTPREREVLVLLVDGLSNRQVARRMGISEHGVKRHVANILGKMGCSNRTLAVATALRHGLCQPSPHAV
jgi:two-component system nitrate/nitrite response regulator NarL